MRPKDKAEIEREGPKAAWTGDVTGGVLNNGVAPKGKQRRQRLFWISDWMLACYSSSERRQRRQKPAGMPLFDKVRVE